MEEQPPQETAKSDVDTSISPKCERIAKSFRGLQEILKEKLPHDIMAQFYLKFLADCMADMECALVEIADIHEDDMDYCTETGPNHAMKTVSIVEEALGIT